MESFLSRSRGLRCTVPWSNRSSSVSSENTNVNNKTNTMMGDPKPTGLLVQRIRDRQWDAVRLRVLTYPWDAQYRSKEMNGATALHLVCLYRAPQDIVELILDAWPKALLSNDSEGWSPLHVCLLYGGDDETALMLIRRGGPQAVSVNSRLVGNPLHLACRHGASAAIIREILKQNPSVALEDNVHKAKPAKMLWYQFSRNPDNERLVNELLASKGRDIDQSIKSLMEKLEALLRAAKRKHSTTAEREDNLFVVHDVVKSTEETIGDLSSFVALAVRLFPEQVRTVVDEYGNLPLHISVSSRPATIPHHDKLKRTLSLPSFTSTVERTDFESVYSCKADPVDVLLQSFPLAARIPNRHGVLPLHLALTKGGRTWRTGVATMVLAAPDVLLARDVGTLLYPFALAAVNTSSSEEESVETVETILELLLACPHALLRQ